MTFLHGLACILGGVFFSLFPFPSPTYSIRSSGGLLAPPNVFWRGSFRQATRIRFGQTGGREIPSHLHSGSSRRGLHHRVACSTYNPGIGAGGASADHLYLTQRRECAFVSPLHRNLAREQSCLPTSLAYRKGVGQMVGDANFIRGTKPVHYVCSSCARRPVWKIEEEPQTSVHGLQQQPERGPSSPLRKRMIAILGSE